MNKASFKLKRKEPGKPTAIYIIYFCDDGRLKFYTGESIDPANWPSKVPAATQAELNRLSAHINSFAASMKIKGERLTIEALKESLSTVRISRSKDLTSVKAAAPVTKTFFEAMEDVVDRMEDGVILTPKDAKRYSAGSIKTFRFTIRVLKKFRPKMTVDSVTMDTYAEFIKYCHGLDYSTNYIGAQIKNWKTLGRAIGGNPIYDAPAFKKLHEETYDIYLNEQELGQIAALNLRHRELVTRDWFILDCYTGLRVSDLKLLTGKNVRDGFITIANEKTDAKVVIPVHSMVKEILDRWNGFPPAVTDVELNRTIKGIAQAAGIDGNVLFTITKGGKRKDEYLKKWEMVSNHTARRSFITNLRKNNVPDSIVMKLTGIRSIVTLQRYDKMQEMEAAQLAAQHDFFK